MTGPQVSRRSLAALLALAVATPLPAFALDVPEPETTDALRALDAAPRLTVQVKVNGQGPYAFLVDTGASGSVISRELVDRLNITAHSRTTIHGLAGSQQADAVLIDTLQVGRRVRRAFPMSVLPGRPMGAAGLLGLEWLGTQGLILDFARKQMRLGSTLPMNDGRTISVPARTRRNGLTLIDGAVSSAHCLAFVDTGSSMTVGNLALLAVARRANAVSEDWVDIELVSATGQVFAGRLAALKTLSLGQMILRNVPVAFGPVHTFEYWGISAKPAILIGADVLRSFDSIALDFNRGAVHFRLPARS
jgi:predicted aspartyl protease